MKNNRYKIWMCISIFMGLTACEMRDELKGKTELNETEGLIQLDLQTKDYTSGLIRSAFPPEEVNVEQYTVQIIDATTERLMKESLFSALKQEGLLKLTAGDYRVKAFNFDGEKMGASERPYFKGETNFRILPGKTTTVNTTCKLSCIEVSLLLDKTFGENFQNDYAITISNGSGGNYIYSSTNISKKIYLNAPENTSSILMSVKATTKEGVSIAQNYTITKPGNVEGETQLENGDSFKITVNPGDSPIIDPVTKIDLGISVDLTWKETGETIEIPTENIVFDESGSGSEGDTSKGDVAVTGLGKTYQVVLGSDGLVTDSPQVLVNIKAPNGIQKMLVNIHSNNEGFMGTLAGFGLGGEFDLANPGDLAPVLTGSLESGEGIGLIDPDKPIKGQTEYLFDLSSFMSLLGLYGESQNTFSITVSDGITPDVKGELIVNVVNNN